MFGQLQRLQVDPDRKPVNVITPFRRIDKVDDCFDLCAMLGMRSILLGPIHDSACWFSKNDNLSWTGGLNSTRTLNQPLDDVFRHFHEGMIEDTPDPIILPMKLSGTCLVGGA